MTTADGTVLGTTALVDNGPATVRWSLVILGDGYQSNQMSQYATDAQRFVDEFLETAPFDIRSPVINVYRVDVTSTDSGADDPTTCGGSGLVARTYFDAAFCGQIQGVRLRRLLTVNRRTAISVADGQVPWWDSIVVIVNSTVYGGSGGVPAVFSLAANAAQIAIHEMGHSAFGLADEYEYLRGCNSGETTQNRHPSVEPVEPNVTINTNRLTLKWRSLVAPSTPIPTTRNANCTICDPQPDPFPGAVVVGLYEGAHYYHCGAFRPVFNCKMRNLTTNTTPPVPIPFCPVCQLRIRQVLPTVVPDVVDFSTAGAARIIRLHDLVPQFTGQQGPGARVRSQSPRSGVVVRSGSTVTCELRIGNP